MKNKTSNKKLNIINSFSEKEASEPTIPVSIVLQEAENLRDWCMKDKEILVRSGLDWKLVDDLPEKIGKLRLTQSKWSSEHTFYCGYLAKWRDAVDAAFNLRDELVHHFYHAFNNKKKEYVKIREIEKGNKNADMIQDLIDLPEFGLNHIKELKAIGFDLNLLDKAKSKSFEIAELQAKVNTAHKQSNSMHVLRNKAYKELQATVKEIRRVGQYAFWRNEMRLKGYVSFYLRDMNQRRKRLKNAEAENYDEKVKVVKSENSD